MTILSVHQVLEAYLLKMMSEMILEGIKITEPVEAKVDCPEYGFTVKVKIMPIPPKILAALRELMAFDDPPK